MPEDIPKIVYHYTTQNGLIGILKNSSLRCSHVAFMNDSREYGFARELCSEMLSSFNSRDMSDQKITSFMRGARYCWDNYSTYREDNEPYLAGSFSEDSDDLSLWRAYSGTGARFSIGFRTEALMQLAKAHSMKFDRVQYVGRDNGKVSGGALKRKDVIAEMENRFLQIREQQWPDVTDFDTEEFLGDYDNILRSLLRDVRYKDEGFAVEKEWRIFGDATVAGFREGNSFVVPYTELKLEKKNGPIGHIVVGPGPHKELSQMSVEMLWRHHEWQNIELSVSAIPFVDW